MPQDFQTLILGEGADILLVSYQDRVSCSIHKGVEIRMPTEVAHSAESSGHTISSTVPVEFITDEQKLPPGFIQNIPTGGKEFFATHTNLRYSPVIVQFPLSGIFIPGIMRQDL